MKIIDNINQEKLDVVMRKTTGISKNNVVLPEKNNILRAFEVDVSDINVIIIGQDPYHGYGQANGYAFAVSKGVKMPPSLRNIFKEVVAEFGETKADETLSFWVEQGVLLMNTVLTVTQGQPNSHANIGWQEITKEIIQLFSTEEVIFLLLGNYAQNIAHECGIPESKVVKTTHPSPFSAHRGFIGSDVFKHVNKKLNTINKKEIIW